MLWESFDSIINLTIKNLMQNKRKEGGSGQ